LTRLAGTNPAAGQNSTSLQQPFSWLNIRQSAFLSICRNLRSATPVPSVGAFPDQFIFASTRYPLLRVKAVFDFIIQAVRSDALMGP
jgi:hypothetical protein